jgi:hypothetical protein
MHTAATVTSHTAGTAVTAVAHQGSWTADLLASAVVLGAVAWALELVLGL